VSTGQVEPQTSQGNQPERKRKKRCTTKTNGYTNEKGKQRAVFKKEGIQNIFLFIFSYKVSL
jgi:hypothetical protein